MKKNNEEVFTKEVTDPEEIQWIEENCYIEDGKRKHRTTEVEGRKFRLDNYPKLSDVEKAVIDSAIDGALSDYAAEYNRLPKTDGRDERRRISSMLRSGIDGLKSLNDTNTAKVLQKHLDELPDTVVTKNEILKKARKDMQDNCRTLGKSLFKEISNQMLIHFEDEAPGFSAPTDDNVEIFTFDEIGFFKK